MTCYETRKKWWRNLWGKKRTKMNLFFVDEFLFIHIFLFLKDVAFLCCIFFSGMDEKFKSKQSRFEENKSF